MNAYRSSLLHVVSKPAGPWPEFMADAAGSLPAFAHHVALRWSPEDPDQERLDKYLKALGVVAVYYVPEDVPLLARELGADAVLWYGAPPVADECLSDVGQAHVQMLGEPEELVPGNVRRININPYVDSNRTLIEFRKSRSTRRKGHRSVYGVLCGNRDSFDPEWAAAVIRCLHPDREGLVLQAEPKDITPELHQVITPFKAAKAMFLAGFGPGALVRHCAACDVIVCAGDARATITTLVTGLPVTNLPTLTSRAGRCPFAEKRDGRVMYRGWDSNSQAGLFQYEVYQTIKCPYKL